MVDLRDTLSDHQSGLEALLGKIPGYSGYKEKELRREADQKLRDHLASQLSDQLSQAEDVASQMLTGPGLMQLDEMGKGNTRLQTLIDKVKTAAQGYAGFFDAVKIKEDELDMMKEKAGSAGLDILTTEKDAARLPAGFRMPGWILGIDMCIEDEQKWRSLINGIIN